MTNTELLGGEVLRVSRGVAVRQEGSSALLHHARTDELHVVGPTGGYVLLLCDGVRTVEEVTDVLGSSITENPELVRSRVQEFLAAMIERGILERSHD